MNEIERLQQLAGIQRQISEDEDTGTEVEKTVIGHRDDERDMIKKELYQMGKYCVELYKMLDELPDDADFPHWWQGKLVKAKEYISATKHYLENEIEAPDQGVYDQDVEVSISPDAEDYSDPSGLS